MKKCLLIASLACLILLSGCVTPAAEFAKLPPGIWRGTLNLENTEVITQDQAGLKKITEAELPFNFEVIYDTEQDFHIELINGSERIRVDDISYGRDKATAKDTVLIKFPVFDTYIRAIYSENVLQGHWFVPYKDDYKVPFVANFGRDHRFESSSDSISIDLNGKWKTMFDAGQESEYPAIANFKQEGTNLTGTFRTETGDYRYLDGHASYNKFALSCFDGAHAFLFKGKLNLDGKIIGEFRSGNHYKSIWEAQRDDSFVLKSPLNLSAPTTQNAIDFSFPNHEGKPISLSDEKYQDKVKLIKIMGTWCPNCKDETKFILDYLEKNSSANYEVIAISFERYKEQAKSLEVITRFKDKMNIPYEVLYGGIYNKSEAAKKLPFMDSVISYPTLLFVDKNNKIRKIYTGFNGPATEEYEAFKAEFQATLNSLLAEI